MSRSQLILRDADLADADAIARIYNQGIEDRMATLETELRSADERARWLVERSTRHPVMVAQLDGALVGWASLNVFNHRPVYQHVADFSIYVAREHRGKGIGGVLLDAVEDRARALGFHKLVLAALARNTAGTRLYERHGFQHVGIHREQGLLDGNWTDVLLMEKILR